MGERFNVVTEEDIRRFERLNKGVVIFDRGGEVVYANSFALELIGRASVEDVGSIWRYIAPEYADLVKKRREMALEGRETPPLVLKLFTADRRIEFVKSRTYPVVYRGKKLIMSVFTREIEDRMKRVLIRNTLDMVRSAVEPVLEDREPSIKEIIEIIYRNAKDVVSPLDMVFIDANGNRIFSTVQTVCPEKDCPVMRSLEEGREIYTTDMERDGKIFTVFSEPVVVSGKIVGVLGFRSEGYGSISPEDVDLFRTIGEIVSLTLGFSEKFKKMVEEREELFRKAMRDSLTGAYTRHYFEEFVRKMISYVLRNGGSVSVVVIDIDGLKMVNDNFGHLEGDRLLKDFADTVMRNIRESDFLIRTGGDEFLLVLSGSNEDEAEEVMRRISESMEKLDRIPPIRFSYGVASIEKDVCDAIKRADLRMYEMKRSHR